jgi:hypothetical protein
MRARRLGDGRYVDVEFHEDPENQAKGDLILSFWLDSQLGQETAFKYFLPSDSE